MRTCRFLRNNLECLLSTLAASRAYSSRPALRQVSSRILSFPFISRALVRLLLQFGSICNGSETIESILGPSVFASQSDLLTDAPKPAAKDALRLLARDSDLRSQFTDRFKSLVVSKVEETVARVRARNDSNLTSEELDFILEDMFVNLDDWNAKQNASAGNDSSIHDMQGSKSSPHDGLLSILALYLAVANEKKGVRGFAEIWKEFVLELRWHWSNLREIPRIVVEGGPDMRYCLLHQKIQMLQCCITHEIARNKLKEEARAQMIKSMQSGVGEAEAATDIKPSKMKTSLMKEHSASSTDDSVGM